MDFISRQAKAMVGSISNLQKIAQNLLTKRITYTEDAPMVPQIPTSANYKGFDIPKEQYDQLFKPIYFGEVSNRSDDKKELEARVILSTILNRILEHNRVGNKWGFKETITQPNAYQAYGSDQYNAYLSGSLDTLGQQKKQVTDSIADRLWIELSQGKFKDVTNNAYYYVHNEKDGSIYYDDKKKLYR